MLTVHTNKTVIVENPSNPNDSYVFENTSGFTDEQFEEFVDALKDGIVSGDIKNSTDATDLALALLDEPNINMLREALDDTNIAYEFYPLPEGAFDPKAVKATEPKGDFLAEIQRLFGA